MHDSSSYNIVALWQLLSAQLKQVSAQILLIAPHISRTLQGAVKEILGFLQSCKEVRENSKDSDWTKRDDIVCSLEWELVSQWTGFQINSSDKRLTFSKMKNILGLPMILNALPLTNPLLSFLLKILRWKGSNTKARKSTHFLPELVLSNFKAGWKEV